MTPQAHHFQVLCNMLLTLIFLVGYGIICFWLGKMVQFQKDFHQHCELMDGMESYSLKPEYRDKLKKELLS